MTNKPYDDHVIDVEIDSSISEEALVCWKKYKNNSINRINISPTSTFKGIQSGNVLNLLDFQTDNKFRKCLDNVIKITKELLEVDIYYYWTHFVEYYRGGYQGYHNHEQNEDYSSILYLNTCRGGETYFESSRICSPKKNTMIIFPSNVNHGAKKTLSWFNNKKVLVFGFRRYQ
tara:strand:- start:405 stop:926 length:522 start_codon:yes stop_codon:yes gene_type:complete